MDKLKDKLKSAAIVLASVADGKVTLIAGVTADPDRQRSRPARWSTWSPSRSAARAAGGRTWRRPAAPAGKPRGGAGVGAGLGRRQVVRTALIAVLPGWLRQVWRRSLTARRSKRLRSTAKKCVSFPNGRWDYVDACQGGRGAADGSQYLGKPGAPRKRQAACSASAASSARRQGLQPGSLNPAALRAMSGYRFCPQCGSGLVARDIGRRVAPGMPRRGLGVPRGQPGCRWSRRSSRHAGRVRSARKRRLAGKFRLVARVPPRPTGARARPREVGEELGLPGRPRSSWSASTFSRGKPVDHRSSRHRRRTHCPQRGTGGGPADCSGQAQALGFRHRSRCATG